MFSLYITVNGTNTTAVSAVNAGCGIACVIGMVVAIILIIILILIIAGMSCWMHKEKRRAATKMDKYDTGSIKGYEHRYILFHSSLWHNIGIQSAGPVMLLCNTVITII